MIAGDHHNGVVKLAGCFQGFDRLGDHPIEMLNLHIVIEDVTSHNRMIGKDRRHYDLVRIFSGSSPRTILETSVRFVRPQPETEWFIFRHLREKVVEVSRIVFFCYALEGGLQFLAFEPRTSRIGRSTTRLKSPRAPAFTGETDRVTNFLKQLGVGSKLRRQSTMNVAGLFQSPNRLSR